MTLSRRSDSYEVRDEQLEAALKELADYIEVLDRVTRDLEAAIGPKGTYDVRDFRARHRDVDAYKEASMPMMAEDRGETRSYG